LHTTDFVLAPQHQADDMRTVISRKPNAISDPTLGAVFARLVPARDHLWVHFRMCGSYLGHDFIPPQAI
jgi:hypothetical protein